MSLDTQAVRRLIRLALDEDHVGSDITSELSIEKKLLATGRIIAREQMVFCGGELISLIFQEMKSSVAVTDVISDGSVVKQEAVLARLSGSAREILSAERTILNFLQRLSGVATRTNTFVKMAPPGVEILDTRKTMPGFRFLEKYAVSVGGGRNHRGNLSEMILIKNNHLDANGGDVEKVFKKMSRRSQGIKIECEVRNSEELAKVVAHKPDIIMLDNMGDALLADCVEMIRKRSPNSKIEVSGGITLERLEGLGKLAPILVSVGSLTTRAPNVDISLRIDFRSVP